MRTVFIGYDRREHEAFNVAAYSILRRSAGILIHPLEAEHLTHLLPISIRRNAKLWDIESEAPMSTEFARTRFCVPFIQKRGWALFIDSDIVCLSDINELFELADPQYAVQVVKHDYQPQEDIKMDGQTQTRYKRKNWSSVMLWNCEHRGHDRLSIERLNRWPGRDLHAFQWLEDSEIGELPAEWNYLVGVHPQEDASSAKLMHFTLGGPWFDGWEAKPLDNVWANEQWHCQFRDLAV